MAKFGRIVVNCSAKKIREGTKGTRVATESTLRIQSAPYGKLTHTWNLSNLRLATDL